MSQRFEIFTYKVFQHNQCEISNAISVGKFNETSKKFDNLRIDLQLFSNLHNCPLQIYKVIIPPAVMFDRNSGYEVDLLKELSIDLNFTIAPRTDKLMFMMIGGLTTAFLGTFKVMFPSTCYASFDQVFLIPPNRFYTAFEKLILPFDFYTWLWIFITFIISFVTILVIKMTSKTVQNFVFGSNVKTPMTNLLIAFVGGTQTKLPSRNFARLLLALFLFYCLVIRTCYQTKLYEFMQTNGSTKGLQTIDDLVESELPVDSSKTLSTVYNTTFLRYESILNPYL
jgi:hypothetical protein